jgi:putative addiction module killer protein
MYTLKIFERDGEAPFTKWLSALRDVQARARVRTRLDRLSLGNFGDYRALAGGVFELKIDWGPGYRVYFAIVGDQIVLLLCGGD